MSSAQKKTPAATGAALDNINALNSRIPHAGFVALRHLLDASRTLHSLPALPDDALKGAEILLTRIRSDIDRLSGGGQ